MQVARENEPRVQSNGVFGLPAVCPSPNRRGPYAYFRSVINSY